MFIEHSSNLFIFVVKLGYLVIFSNVGKNIQVRDDCFPPLKSITWLELRVFVSRNMVSMCQMQGNEKKKSNNK